MEAFFSPLQNRLKTDICLLLYDSRQVVTFVFLPVKGRLYSFLLDPFQIENI